MGSVGRVLWQECLDTATPSSVLLLTLLEVLYLELLRNKIGTSHLSISTPDVFSEAIFTGLQLLGKLLAGKIKWNSVFCSSLSKRKLNQFSQDQDCWHIVRKYPATPHAVLIITLHRATMNFNNSLYVNESRRWPMVHWCGDPTWRIFRQSSHRNSTGIFCLSKNLRMKATLWRRMGCSPLISAPKQAFDEW